jgi:hypothetical protein
MMNFGYRSKEWSWRNSLRSQSSPLYLCSLRSRMACTSNGRIEDQTRRLKLSTHGRVCFFSAINLLRSLIFVNFLASESRDGDNSWYLSDGESDSHRVPPKRKHEQAEETTYPLQSGTSSLSPEIESSATESKRYRRMKAKRQKLAKQEGNKSSADDSKLVSIQNEKPLERKDISPLDSQPQATANVLGFQPGLRTGSVSHE